MAILDQATIGDLFLMQQALMPELVQTDFQCCRQWITLGVNTGIIGLMPLHIDGNAPTPQQANQKNNLAYAKRNGDIITAGQCNDQAQAYGWKTRQQDKVYHGCHFNPRVFPPPYPNN